MITTHTLADTSKTWIYQSNRAFTPEEAIEIQNHIHVFCRNWVSHSNELKAAGQLINNRFIVLMVDESKAGASGCSIDKSVHFIKSIGSKYQTEMFDRMKPPVGYESHQEFYDDLYKESHSVLSEFPIEEEKNKEKMQ